MLKKEAPTGLAGLAEVSALSELSAIRDRPNAGVIWQRQAPPEFQKWIEELEPEQLPSARVLVRPDGVKHALSKLCTDAGTPQNDFSQFLVEDASNMAKTFAEIMESPFIAVRMEVVDSNACRKFHIDYIRARLICTYRGPGTQCGTSINNQEPKEIHNVPALSPIVLRGTQWPEEPDSGLRHRSPPIEGTGETRLLFVVDPIFKAENGECEQMGYEIMI